MYVPKQFEETRPEALRALIRDYPLATLVTSGRRGIEANHVPLQWRPGVTASGILRGHLARANPAWREHDPAAEVLAVFSGPQAYITPSWYATKREHGRVVPTWNYTVVHGRGRLRVIEDAAALHVLVTSLTGQQESAQPEPWAVDDAPADHVERLLGAIVGIEIELTQLTGKWKVSQNQPDANRDGVVRGLEALATDEARAMAARVGAGSTPAG
ncbi:MAG: FMN-binding negative transcriptional regulator [Nevskia sp.]